MNPVKLTFKIDLDNEQQVLLAKKFMSDLKGTSGKIPKIEGKVSDIRTKEEAPKQEPSKQEAPKQEVTEFPKNKVTLDMISKKTGEKVGEHRDAIKSELTRLGVGRAGELDESQYAEYYKFLCDL